MKGSTIINIGLGLLAIMMFGCHKLDPAEVLKQKEQQISEQTRSWRNAIDSVLALGG